MVPNTTPVPTTTRDTGLVAHNQTVDLIILGGGCAGLSLASHLAQQANPPRVVVVEARSTYCEDRTWCGWRVSPHLFEDCALAEWSHWCVASSQVTPRVVITRSSERYCYERISSISFYEKALRRIAGAPSVTLLTDASAMSVLEAEDFVVVTLQDGCRISAPWVIDTRPQQQAVDRPWLWQNFVGYEVEVPEVQRNTWGNLPMLMDFHAAGSAIAQFMYIIPDDKGHYLCEWTRFSRNHGEESEIEAELRAWLRGQLDDSGWVLRRRESGSLPMCPPQTTSSSRIIDAGTRGGSMRAATGYAFHAIQRWAVSCAASIEAIGAPIAPPRSPMMTLMDEIFLRVLQREDTSAAEIFLTLFAKVPPESLVRFLSGCAKATDLWSVAKPLPWSRFMQEFWVTLLSRSTEARSKGIA